MSPPLACTDDSKQARYRPPPPGRNFEAAVFWHNPGLNPRMRRTPDVIQNRKSSAQSVAAATWPSQPPRPRAPGSNVEYSLQSMPNYHFFKASTEPAGFRPETGICPRPAPRRPPCRNAAFPSLARFSLAASRLDANATDARQIGKPRQRFKKNRPKIGRRAGEKRLIATAMRRNACHRVTWQPRFFGLGCRMPFALPPVAALVRGTSSQFGETHSGMSAAGFSRRFGWPGSGPKMKVSMMKSQPCGSIMWADNR